MKMKERINKVKGRVSIKQYDHNMNLIDSRDIDNLVVSTGLSWIASRLNDPTPAVMNYIAVGTGTTAPILSNTTLEVEIYRAPVDIPGGSVSTNQLSFTQSIPAGSATGALTEAGIFDLVSGGTMLSRVTYAVLNKGPSDTVAVNWTITVG